MGVANIVEWTDPQETPSTSAVSCDQSLPGIQTAPARTSKDVRIPLDMVI